MFITTIINDNNDNKFDLYLTCKVFFAYKMVL